MVETDVIVPIDKQKQPETVDLAFQGKTQRQKFMYLLRQEQVKYTREHKPFCFRCAKIDYEKAQEDLFKEKGKRSGGDRIENVPITLNLKEYADPKRFTQDDDMIIHDVKIMDGMKVPVEVRKYNEYTCNTRGCGHSVETPIIRK